MDAETLEGLRKLGKVRLTYRVKLACDYEYLLSSDQLVTAGAMEYCRYSGDDHEPEQPIVEAELLDVHVTVAKCPRKLWDSGIQYAVTM